MDFSSSIFRENGNSKTLRENSKISLGNFKISNGTPGTSKGNGNSKTSRYKTVDSSGK